MLAWVANNLLDVANSGEFSSVNHDNVRFELLAGKPQDPVTKTEAAGLILFALSSHIIPLVGICENDDPAVAVAVVL